MSQREVFAFDDLGIPIDNIEGTEMVASPAQDYGRVRSRIPDAPSLSRVVGDRGSVPWLVR